MTNNPVKLEARLDPNVSRALWLVKWLLAIPHYILLFFLWMVFWVFTVVAFFAILFTGRYPRAIFDFNVGVLRWNWRVAFYAYSALGTDRYPPFTLEDVPDYPARLEVAYPERLSHGLVLVKWILAIPHFLVLAVLLGGGPYLSYRWEDSNVSFEGGGLIGLLVLIAGFVLLFSGRYPRDLFALIMGLNRWVYRVAGYVTLMTDQYPPFRLDTGGEEPTAELPGPTTGTTALPAAGAAMPPAAGAAPPADAASSAATTQPGEPGPGPSTAGEPPHPQDVQRAAPPPPPPRRKWSPGRIVSVIIGTLLIAAGLAAIPIGAVGLWLDQTARDSAGFIGTDLHRFSSPNYALTSEPGALRFDGPDWVMHRILGDVRVSGESAQSTPLFIGIAPTEEAAAYLEPTAHTVVSDLDGDPLTPKYRQHDGNAPDTLPGDATFWVASAAGTGSQAVRWDARTGDWSVVVMNADGSRPVDAELAVAATLPWLDDLAFWFIGTGLVLLLGGALLVALAINRQQRATEMAT
ncbi:MAG TPA: DUF4389 domain-containing protein [Kribbella sp.]|nr:DUF4389 domain-containing protein [Kribbella sp.]